MFTKCYLSGPNYPQCSFTHSWRITECARLRKTDTRQRLVQSLSRGTKYCKCWLQCLWNATTGVFLLWNMKKNCMQTILSRIYFVALQKQMNLWVLENERNSFNHYTCVCSQMLALTHNYCLLIVYYKWNIYNTLQMI